MIGLSSAMFALTGMLELCLVWGVFYPLCLEGVVVLLLAAWQIENRSRIASVLLSMYSVIGLIFYPCYFSIRAIAEACLYKFLSYKVLQETHLLWILKHIDPSGSPEFWIPCFAFLAYFTCLWFIYLTRSSIRALRYIRFKQEQQSPQNTSSQSVP